MKQYIRTPSEIYDLDDLYVCEELNGKPYGVKGSGFCIYKESIIKTANTIEELCDFFDVLWFDEKYEIYLLPKEECCITILLGYPRNKIREWRFGIRTDKGLIYVAKMNDKGELELL